MKKAVCLVFVLALLVAIALPAFAVPARETTIQGAGYQIVERVEDNRILREFTRGESENGIMTLSSEGQSCDMDEVLLDLGMDQRGIDGLSEEERDDVENCEWITSVSSYIKVAEDGTTTYLSEEETLQAVREIEYDAEDIVSDTYMYVWHGVLYLGNAAYRLITNAYWYTMPIFRGLDAIGACAQNLTITPNTYTAYYSYDYIRTINGVETESSSGNITISNIDEASNGNFYGAAAMFYLPVDGTYEGYSTEYSNVYAHFSYEGHMVYPNQTCWFNTSWSYVHMTVGISGAPSVSVTPSGASGVIDLNITAVRERRNVLLEVLYTP